MPPTQSIGIPCISRCPKIFPQPKTQFVGNQVFTILRVEYTMNENVRVFVRHMASLTGLVFISPATRHFRAGLSHVVPAALGSYRKGVRARVESLLRELPRGFSPKPNYPRRGSSVSVLVVTSCHRIRQKVPTAYRFCESATEVESCWPPRTDKRPA
jgi:hypothetical protein